jgi:hypothetical protein
MAKMWRHQSINIRRRRRNENGWRISRHPYRQRNGGEEYNALAMASAASWRGMAAWRSSIINGGWRMAVNLALAAKPLASGGESEEETAAISMKARLNEISKSAAAAAMKNQCRRNQQRLSAKSQRLAKISARRRKRIWRRKMAASGVTKM